MHSVISFLVRFIPRKYLQRVSQLGLRVLGFAYMGKGVTCPVCESSYREFLPYGRIKARKNALCPKCQSLERHRLIYLYLKERTDFFSRRLNVLHIAPEACFIPRFTRQHGEGYVTADIESPLAKVKMDIHRMPFDDNHFDVLLCNHVLEHVQDDGVALSEIRRVLKPGGFAILQVPFFHPVPEKTFEDNAITDPRERERIFGQTDHVRKYGHDYAERIRASGLQAFADDFVTTIEPSLQFKYGVSPTEIIYKAVK